MGNAVVRACAVIGAVAALVGASQAWAQERAKASPPVSVCNTQPPAAACPAVRGDRADGWAAQSRAEVMATHGIVTTSQPLAAQAGLQIMMNGGNAIDAAVATAAVLNLVEPMNTGVGGDLFAIIYVAKEKKLYTLNASGMAPSGATLERFNALGYHADPEHWGPGSVKPWYIDGKRPVAGQIYRNPDLARTFRLLQEGGRDAFYKGEIARAIVAKSQSLGGSMTMDDLANYRGEFVEAATSNYHGYDV